MWYMSGNFKVVIDGVTVYQSASRIQLKNGTVVASGTYTFQHNTDGSKSFTASAEAGIYTVAVNCRGSGSFTLDTIPRASTPSVSSSSVFMGSAVTINTNRASSAFAHDLAYSFAGAAYVTIKNGVGASYSWTTPDLASKIPSATSGTITIRCTTKNGGTTVGTKTITMTLKVPTTVVPTISSVSAVEATAGLAAQFGAFVNGKSTIRTTISAAGAKGSTIKSYSTTLSGKTYTGSTFTSSAVTVAGSVSMVTTVTDSRGRTAKKTTTITVLDYSPPAITALQVYRVNASGTEDQDGVYVAVRYAYAVTALNSKNKASMVLEYKKSAATGWSSLLSGSALSADTTAYPKTATMSTDYQWDIRMTVTDYFGASAVYAAVLPSGVVILDIGADGTSIGIGKTAEWPHTLDIDFDTRIRGKLIAPDGGASFDVSQIFGLAKALSTQYQLDTTITKGTNYTSVTGYAQLVGNSVRCNIFATRSSNTGTGNIGNEAVCSFTIQHGGKIKNFDSVSFVTGAAGGGGFFQMEETANSGTTVTFKVTLAAAASAFKTFNAYFIVPVTLDFSKF